ncbi:MAG: alpha/beta fold hydrolase [Chlorobi bacterium]|nr:alpha/beta fold hydrolase [Chlorobiota bacterium]
MSIIKDNNFKPNVFFKNKHINTIYRHFVSKTEVNYERERMQTRDGDFLDLDKSLKNSNKLILAIHGLEGSSDSTYIKSLVHSANNKGFDVIALNLRGCSGEQNKKLNSYHSGKTEDVWDVIQYINEKYSYEEINIVGYSLGGNLTLKFMGEFAEKLPKNIKSAVAISTPCDLKGSAYTLSKGFNKVYQYRFIKSLRKKSEEKFQLFPNNNLNENKILASKSFKEFDNYFTAKANGFKNADDYWKKSSSKQFIKFINKPTLLISALDDPFLNESCYPFEEAKNHKHFNFLPTKYGGHVGFYQNFNSKKNTWLNDTILNFINKS